tara:strand:- start:96 stop:2576 length:2481 start_codon:yes stop_codon:yes gene_type:complete
MSYKTGFYEGRLGIGLGSTMGMGDGNPRYSLDINGDIRLTGSIVNGDGQILSLTPPEYTPVEVGLDANNSLIYNFEKQGTHTGSQNILIGKHAGTDLTSGSNNICLGKEAGGNLTSGTDNICIGRDTGMAALTTNSDAVYIGRRAGQHCSSQNIGIGFQAMQQQAGSNNIGIGYNSLKGGSSNTGRNGNVAIGYHAMPSTSSASYNCAIGWTAGQGVSTGQFNVFMGYQTGISHSTGNRCIFIGDRTGYSNTTADYNIGIGSLAIYGSCTATHNIGIGYECLYEGPNGNGTDNDNGGRYNVCMGYRCGKWISTGTKNVYMGYMAGQGTTHTTGYKNIFIGSVAGEKIETGYRNICIGTNCGMRLKTGNQNTIIGDYAGQYINSASNNICLGKSAGTYIYYGNTNICIGVETANAYSAAVQNMSNCICIGTYTGPKTTDTNNTCKLYIGSPSAQNGNTYRGEDGSFIYGYYNSTTLSSRYLRINGHLGINCNPGTTAHLGLKNGNHTATTSQQILFGFGGVANLEYGHSIRTRHQGQSSGVDTDNSIDFFLWKKGDTTTTIGEKHGMSITAAGVGIGTTSPSYPLHVNGWVQMSSWSGYHVQTGSAGASTGSGQMITIQAQYGIWVGSHGLVVSSDQRIKTNISEVPDNLSLQKLRDISCCYYEYKDKLGRGSEKTIGFIAQQVKEHMPMAVGIQKDIIPNEMRILTNISWEEITDNSSNQYKLTTDLQDVSGVKYRFYVINDPSGNDECKKEIIGNEDNTFTFDTSYNSVFCYGKEVDDFHTLEKAKLFALNFSATQELDRKVIVLENENAELKAELAAIKQHLGI